ncbi:MAG TPA: SDR family oxidoreductase [Acidobacteriota bacterium]|nr:SDR family oxidoreductase [Acidobacteriota bacterium]
MNYSGKSILITGASRGLGQALAFHLAERRARLALVARTTAPLEETVQTIRQRGGIAFAIQADVADKRAIYPIVAQAAELAGPVDILINNASTLGPLPMPLLLDTECEDFGQVLETNLLAPFRLTKAVAGSMVLRGGGVILNISSDAATSAYPNWGAYGVSKAALDHLTRIWAAEFDGTPVKVLSVDPGEMDTQMHADALPEADRATLDSPVTVAQKIISYLENLESMASGTRFLASEVL